MKMVTTLHIDYFLRKLVKEYPGEASKSHPNYTLNMMADNINHFKHIILHKLN
jgi:hypothetical protein